MLQNKLPFRQKDARSNKEGKFRKSLPLQNKLFLAYFLSSEIILIAFALFFYYYVSPILLNNQVDAIKSINDTFVQQIEASIEGLDIVSTNINYSSLMHDKLDENFNVDMSRENLPGLADLFVTINGTDVKADQINLYDLDGHVVRVGYITSTGRVDMNQLDWFDTVLDNKGVKYILSPYYTSDYSVGSLSPDWYISLIRTYSNTYRKNVGAVETIKRCKTIFKPIITYDKKTDGSLKTYIFDGSGHLIYPYDTPVENMDMDPNLYLQALSQLEDGSAFDNPVSGEKERIISNTSLYTEWTYISVLPESNVLTPVYRLKTLLILVVGIIFLLSMMLAYYLAQNMVRPLKNLKDVIQDMEISTLGTQTDTAYPVSYNELDEVHHAFQYLSKKLKTSMDELIDSRQQEMKSMTLALQSQTNPHFYYNTLSSIIILAEDGKNDEVIKLCRSLTQIMRYITDSSLSLVSLKEELDYVEKYLYCMKVRYQSSLDVTIDVDPALYNFKVPKLIIQPLVENALKYGTDCLPPWYIHIKGLVTEDGWEIHVIDSGSGFSQEAIETINERIDFVNRNPGIPEMKIDGLGLVNVYMRWKIHAKDRIIFTFGPSQDGHGQVTIGIKKDEVNQ